eukprot:g11105.t1
MTKVSHALAGAATSSDAEDQRTTALDGGAALAALARTLTALASCTADHFAPWAPEAAKSLVTLFRGCKAGGGPPIAAPVRPTVLAACLDAAGAVIASAWVDQSFQAQKEELAQAAREVLQDASAPSEARASAHHFYARVALACFEEFAPTLEVVLPPALEALRPENSECLAVKPGRGERLAALEALGSYAAALGARFAPHLPSALPAVCSQAQHPRVEVRAGAAMALERMARVLGDLAQGLPSSDQAAASRLAEAVVASLCEILKQPGSKALRSVLEDLDCCPGFWTLAGQSAAASLAAAAGSRRSEDGRELKTWKGSVPVES